MCFIIVHQGAALVWQYKSAEDESRRQLDNFVQCPVLLGSQWCKNINFSTTAMTCDLGHNLAFCYSRPGVLIHAVLVVTTC